MIYSCEDTNYSSNNSNKNGDIDALGVQHIISEKGYSECKKVSNDCRDNKSKFNVSSFPSKSANFQIDL